MAKSVRKKYSHEELMMEAIIESRKSVPEHTDKTDPMVGAIIATKEGVILAKAHRGELREGEHCEYTLIERKLKSENLRSCLKTIEHNSYGRYMYHCDTSIIKPFIIL